MDALRDAMRYKTQFLQLKFFLECIKPTYRDRPPAASQITTFISIFKMKAKMIMKVLYKFTAKASALPVLEIPSSL